MNSHPIVHLEISAKDAAAASQFYADVFGWKVDHDPNFDYYQFAADGGPGGGWVVVNEKDYKAGDVIPYIQTDDIDATLKRIEQQGGKVLAPKSDIQGVGWFALFADPTGNRIGLYTAMQPVR